MKILIVLTSHAELGNTGRKTGFYLSELTHALEPMQRAGFEIDFASPKGGLPPMDGADRRDPANQRFLDDRRWTAQLEQTLPLSRVRPADYDAVYVPGGHGTMFDLPEDAALQGILSSVYAHGGVVAAVCHGPAALVNVRLPDGHPLVEGKEVSAFTNDEEAAMKLTGVMPFLLETRLRERGARFVAAPDFQPQVSVSERLVTGQNPASAAGVGEAVVRLLQTADRARTVPSASAASASASVARVTPSR